MLNRILLCLVAVVGAAHVASAETYYIDGDCEKNGNGLADSCAAGTGTSGQFNDLQSFLNMCAPGDVGVLHAKRGDYVTTFGTGSDTSEDAGYHFECSGTSDAWVTIENAPGEFPVIRNCPATATTQNACNRDTITANGRNFIKITDDDADYANGHIIVFGRIHLAGCESYPPTTASEMAGPIEVSYTEINRGYDETDSGNWAGIWNICHTGSLIHHNFITLSKPTGAGQQSSASCVSQYFGVGGTIEHNTCNLDPNSQFPESHSGCFDDKVVASRNTYRFNRCYNATRFGRFAEGNYCKVEGVECFLKNGEVYGNLAYRGSYRGPNRPALQISEGLGGMSGGGVDGLDIYNNTWVGFGGCYYVLPQANGSHAAGLKNVRIYNNLCANIANDSSDDADIVLWWADTRDKPARFSYECHDASIGDSTIYRVGSTSYSKFAAFQGAGYGAGIVRTNSYGFVNAARGDFGLSGGPCVGMGHVGGVESGAKVDAGFTGVGRCVGHECGPAASVTTSPPTVQKTR